MRRWSELECHLRVMGLGDKLAMKAQGCKYSRMTKSCLKVYFCVWGNTWPLTELRMLAGDPIKRGKCLKFIFRCVELELLSDYPNLK